MNNIVILDVETTGDNYLLDEICQMSYIILDKDLSILKAKNFFFMVDYVHFKSNKKKLNIDELKLLSNNKTFKDRYDEIFNDLNNNLIVCHKCDHDISFLKSEFMRVDNKNNFIYEEFCTMKYYTNILKLPSKSFGYKYPKLMEIMPYLNIKRGDIKQKSKEIFNLPDDEINFHDSRVDSVATYLIAMKTEELITKYRNLSNELLDDTQNLCGENENDKNVDILNNNIYYNNNKKSKNNIIKDLISFKGKIGRRKYIIYFIAIICIYYMFEKLMMKDMIISGEFNRTGINSLSRVLEIARNLTLIPITIKRLRDSDKSKWLSLLLFVPFINLLLILELCFIKGIEESTKQNEIYIKEIKKKNKVTFIVVFIITLATIVFSIKFKNQNNIINKVKNYKENGHTVQSLVENNTENKIVYGWDIDKVDDDTYLVSYEFDEDDNEENGTNMFVYEYYEPLDMINVIYGESAKPYADSGYIDSSSIRLVEGAYIINTTHNNLENGEVKGDSYTPNKELAKINLEKNKSINSSGYDDEEEMLYHDELIYTDGKRATVYIVDDSNAYHVDKDCKGLKGTGTVYKVFLDDARAENRTMCTYERESK